MVLQVKEWYDYDGKLNLVIDWDKNDPTERQFNDWTADDFLTAIKNASDQELSMGDTICSDISQRVCVTGPSQENLS